MKKREYTDVENAKYILSNAWKWDKKGMLFAFLKIPFGVLLPMLTALMVKIMLDGIEKGISVLQMALLVLSLAFLIAGLTWTLEYISARTDPFLHGIKLRFEIMSLKKRMTTDYANIESFEGRKIYERGKEFLTPYSNRNSAAFLIGIVEILLGLTGLFSYLIILTVLDAWLIFFLLFIAVLDYVLMALYEKRLSKWLDARSSISHAMWYFERASSNIDAGKDVRVFQMKHWLMSVVSALILPYMKLSNKYMHSSMKLSVGRGAVLLIRDLVSFIFLATLAVRGTITIANFLFYFGLISGFSAWISSISQNSLVLQGSAKRCGSYRAFLEMPDTTQTTGTKDLPNETDYPLGIEFQNVSFRYDGSEHDTLENINLNVSPGEKIAIVGENGAGKTTLVKLLCGFYEPSSGTVLVCDTNREEFGRDDYFKLFSAVFQDYYFLPTSIAENVALTKKEHIDYKKIEKLLKQVGLYDKIADLENGLDTPMLREIHKKAAVFSGGQEQKLLLARALYKNAPILVLDEPTAALDPMAENELYEQYNEFTKGKTSFFISHRLSSTRFCDRIIFLSNHKIVEEGTHEELMAMKGHYFRMFQIQSYYYNCEKEMIV